MWVNMRCFTTWSEKCSLKALECFCVYSDVTIIITPVLKELHWLSVRYRIHFKIQLLTFKALNGMAPAYISDLINVRKHTCYSLRYNSGTILLHPAGKMKKSFGDRCFSVAAPTL